MGEVLNLSEVFERDEVKLPDGSTVALRNTDEFGIIEEHRLRTLVDQVRKVTAVNSEEDAEKASQLLRDIAAMVVVDGPADLPDWVCVAVFRFWTDRAKAKAAVDGPPPKRPKRRTSAGSSRGSKPSTAATRKRGSTSPRTS